MHLVRRLSSGTILSAEHESSASEVGEVFLFSAVSVSGSFSASEVGEVSLFSAPDALSCLTPEDDEGSDSLRLAISASAFSALSTEANTTSFALFMDLGFLDLPVPVL